MKSQIPQFIRLVLAGFALFILSFQGYGQIAIPALDSYTAQVHTLLRHYEGVLDLSGQSHEIMSGNLSDAGTQVFIVDLKAGVTYYILGVCDEDCIDLDLEISNSANKVLDKDIEVDAFPLLSLTPPHDGRFSIKLTMEDCQAGPCRYGLAIYTQ